MRLSLLKTRFPSPPSDYGIIHSGYFGREGVMVNVGRDMVGFVSGKQECA